MSMYIAVNGKVIFDGLEVHGTRKPYVIIDGNRVYLEDDEAKVVRSLRRTSRLMKEVDSDVGTR